MPSPHRCHNCGQDFDSPRAYCPRCGQPNCATYTGLISDHLPLVARFRVTNDDD